MKLSAPAFLFQDNGRLVQPVIVVDEGDELPTDAQFAAVVGRRNIRITAADCAYGKGRYRIPVGQIDRPVTATITLTGIGIDRNIGTVELRPARQQTAHLVHHAHQDLGWADRPSIMRQRMVNYIDDALDLAASTSERPADAQFRWNVESMYLVEDFLAARGSQGEERLVDAMRSGHLEVGALYAGVESELHSLAELMHITRAAVKLRRRLGVPISTAILNDVPGWAWSLPSVLAQSGITFLLWGPDPIRAMTHKSNRHPLFWAESPDGRRVLVYQSPFAYIDAFPLVFRDAEDAEELLDRLLSSYEDVVSFPEDDVLLHTAHDFNPPFGSLSDLVESWNQRWAFPHLRMSLARDYFEATSTSSGSVPVLRGAFPDSWTDGVGSAAQHIADKRTTARRVNAAQTASAFTQRIDPPADTWHARIGGMFPPMAMRLAKRPWLDYPAAEIERAFGDLLILDEHTWGSVEGADNYHGYTRAHWLEREAVLWDTANKAEILELSAGTFIAREAGRSDRSFTLLNTTSCGRTGPTTVRLPVEWVSSQTAVVDDATGGLVEYAVRAIDSDQDAVTVELDTPEVPAFGYRTFSVTSTTKTAGGHEPNLELPAPSPTIIESEHYRVVIDDASGAIRSWVDKDLDLELIDQDGPFCLNQIVLRTREEIAHDLGQFDEYQLTGAETWALAADIGRRLETLDEFTSTMIEVRALDVAGQGMSVVCHVDDFLEVETDYVLPAGRKVLLVENRIRKLRYQEREAAYVAFPMAVNSAVTDVEGPGYVFTPGEQLPGSMFDHYTVHEWVRVRNDDFEIVLVPIDAPLVTVGDINTDRWLQSITDGNGHLFSYAFNHSWWTNFPTKQVGRITSRFALTSRSVTDRRTCHQFAERETQPIQAFITTGQRAYSSIPPMGRFLDVQGATVIFVAAIGSGHEHIGLQIGVLETEGSASEVTISLGIGRGNIAAAFHIDLSGNRLAEIDHSVTTATATLAANDLAVIELLIAR